jgi:hypothetical protein
VPSRAFSRGRRGQRLHLPFPPRHTTRAPADIAAMDDKDNANPTILNASDLPSRRSDATARRRDDGGTGLFDDLVPRYNYLSDPFEAPLSASDSDDDVVEGIDEQEIFGAHARPGACPIHPHAPAVSRARADHSHDRPHLHHLRP